MKTQVKRFRTLDELRQAEDLPEYVMGCIDKVMNDGNYEEFSQKYPNFVDYFLEYADRFCLKPDDVQTPNDAIPERGDVMQRYSEYFGDGQGLFSVEKTLSSATINLEQSRKVIATWQEIASKMLEK